MRIFLWVILFVMSYYQLFTKSRIGGLYPIIEDKITIKTLPLKKVQYISGFSDEDDELKKISNENAILKKSHTQEKKFHNSIAVISLLSFFILLGLTYTYYRKQKYYKTLYFEAITNREKINIEYQYENTQVEISSPIHDQLDINPLIVENILSYLNTFELKKKYLIKDISLLNMAKECGTNTAYLSKVINHYKKNNFASYLNNLRLNHAVELWKTTPRLRYKSIQEMADMVGFKTAQSFSKKFHEKYKTTPTYFLKDLNQNIQKNIA